MGKRSGSTVSGLVRQPRELEGRKKDRYEMRKDRAGEDGCDIADE